MECVEYLLGRKKKGSFPPHQNRDIKEADIDLSDFRIWVLKGNFREVFRSLK